MWLGTAILPRVGVPTPKLKLKEGLVCPITRKWETEKEVRYSILSLYLCFMVCVQEEDLFEIDVPLEFQLTVVAAYVHHLACWFDVLFDDRYFHYCHWYVLLSRRRRPPNQCLVLSYLYPCNFVCKECMIWLRISVGTPK